MEVAEDAIQVLAVFLFVARQVRHLALERIVVLFFSCFVIWYHRYWVSIENSTEPFAMATINVEYSPITRGFHTVTLFNGRQRWVTVTSHTPSWLAFIADFEQVSFVSLVYFGRRTEIDHEIDRCQHLIFEFLSTRIVRDSSVGFRFFFVCLFGWLVGCLFVLPDSDAWQRWATSGPTGTTSSGTPARSWPPGRYATFLINSASISRASIFCRLCNTAKTSPNVFDRLLLFFLYKLVMGTETISVWSDKNCFNRSLWWRFIGFHLGLFLFLW